MATMPWEVERCRVVDSTQTVARKHAESGFSGPVVFVANEQTHGRGRRGRSWESPHGGLYMTAVIRPAGPIGLIPLLAGVAVAETLREHLGVEAELKWPNDVLIGGRKVGGVLVEAGWSDDEPTYILMGIGVNLNNPLPDGLKATTTLNIETGEDVDKDAFLNLLVDRIASLVSQLKKDSESILERWRRLACLLGERVTVSDATGEVFTGVAVDVDGEGALLVESGGSVKRVLSGDVDASVKFSGG